MLCCVVWGVYCAGADAGATKQEQEREQEQEDGHKARQARLQDRIGSDRIG